jgi:hypothetical protein
VKREVNQNLNLAPVEATTIEHQYFLTGATPELLSQPVGALRFGAKFERYCTVWYFFGVTKRGDQYLAVSQSGPKDWSIVSAA